MSNEQKQPTAVAIMSDDSKHTGYDTFQKPAINNDAHTNPEKSKNGSDYADLRVTVINDILKPSIKEDIEDAIASRHRWLTYSTMSYSFAELFSLATVIVIFAAGFYGDRTLTFVSGCCGVVASSLQRFGAFSNAKNEERTKQANELLASIGVNKSLAMLDDDVKDPSVGSENTSAPNPVPNNTAANKE